MAFSTIPGTGANDATSFIGTSGVDLILIQSFDERVFADGRGEFDVIDFRSSAGLVSEYTLRGGDGDDAIRSIGANAVRSLFNGNKGADIITIDNVTQSSVFGGQGADLISLSTLSSVLVDGNQGNDLINLFVGASSSSVFGGDDNDGFLLGGEIISSVVRGDSGNDVIQFFGGASLSNSTVNGNSGNDVIRLLGNVTMDNANSSIFGGIGDDIIDAAANSFSTILIGNAGNDSITGGSNIDSLFGGDGADRIVGNSGADRMQGEAGGDTFAYLTGSSGEAQTGNVLTGVIDQLIDFTSGADVISGFGVAGAGEFTLIGGADTTYASLRATVNGSAFAGDYVLGVYGSGSSWTAVLFTEIGNAAAGFTAAGAIQIGTVGQFTTALQAFSAIAASDILA